MRLPSNPSSAIVDYLNTTYFNEVWNSTQTHGRQNFELQKASLRLSIGSVSVNGSVVGLPTTDTAYAVYQTSYTNFGKFFNIPYGEWVTDLSVLTTMGIQISTYANTARLCPNGSMSLYFDILSNKVVVAIPSTIVTKCTDQVYPTMYVTVYEDTPRNTPSINQLFTVSTALNATVTPSVVGSAITSASLLYPHSTIVYVNGWAYDPTNVPILTNGDVVYIFSDPEIVGHCDIAVDDSNNGYYSTLYGEYREILHIPKSLNSSNIIITNDTIDVVVWDPVSKKGLYGIRVDPHAIMSITHNDFSMSRSILQGFMNTLGAQSVVVRLFVRFNTAPVYLGEDVNDISDLYSLTDDQIQKQLIQSAAPQIVEWAAANLEQSAYLPLLYNSTGFNATNILPQLIDAMGYYDVASVLGQCMRQYTYNNDRVQVYKPVRLYGLPCDAIVYANGRKVPQDLYTISDYNCESFLLGFSASAYVAVGSLIQVYITEADFRVPLIFNPTSLSPSISVLNNDYRLYTVTHYSTPQPAWYNTTTNVGYEEITINNLDYTVTQNTDGSYTYTVTPVHYGANFYLVPKYGMTTATYDIDTMLSSKQPVIINLEVTDSNMNVVPLFGYTTLEIYLNGYALVNNVDYTITQISGTNNEILQTVLMVSNSDYLNLTITGNTVEVVSHGDTVISQDSGYSISDMMYRTSLPTLWSASVGRVFAHGLLTNGVTESGNVLTSTNPITDGSIYLLTYTMPYGVSKLLENYSPNTDRDLKTRVDRLLGVTTPTYPSTVLISHLYSLYSPFIAKIVCDVIAGTLIIANEGTDENFLQQFAPYTVILNADPTIGSSNTLIDRRFCSLAADYANYTVTDITQMQMIQRLINLTLTPGVLSIKEVLL